MKSIPAASAMRARRRQSGQLADQRSGTVVAERPDEQLAPKIPIFSARVLSMAMRSRIAPARASTPRSPPACYSRASFLLPTIPPSLPDRQLDAWTVHHILMMDAALD